MKRFFPQAMHQEDVIKAATDIIHGLGMTNKNTLFAHSVCPDEINHDEGEITDALRDHFNGHFSLGGLAGIPFSG